MGIEDLTKFAQSRGPAAGVSALLTVDKRNPDEVADQLRVGTELGVPANVIGTAPEQFKRRAEQAKTYESLVDAPKTAAWLAERMNAGLARDDVQNLSWFEKFWKDQGRAWVHIGDQFPNVEGFGGAILRAGQRGIDRISAAPSAATAMRTANVLAVAGQDFDTLFAEELSSMGYTPENAPAAIKLDAARAARFRSENFGQITDSERADIVRRGAEAMTKARTILDDVAAIPMSEPATRFRDNLTANPDKSILALLQSVGSDPAGAAAFVGEMAAEFLPVLAASTATTAATRSPAAGIAVMGAGSFLTENTVSAMDFLAEKGIDVSTPEAAAAVLADADLMREARTRGLTRGITIALLDMVSGGVAGKALMKSRVGEAVVQGVAQMVFGGAGEGFAQLFAGQDMNWQDIALEAMAELVTAPIEIGGVAGRALIRKVESAGKSDTTAARLKEVDARVAESRLKTRAPEKFAEFIAQTGAPNELLYVPADDLVTYFQDRDIPLDEGLTSFGIERADFDEMEASGNSVAVPMSDYATRISGTEDAAWFHDHATLNPDEMSAVEAKRFNEEVREVMRDAIDAVERQREEDLNSRASDAQVYDGIFTQLRAAGRTRSVADSEARVWSAFFRTMGERYGEDPLDLARSMHVQIRGPERDPGRVRTNLDIALNTLRAGKGVKPRGESIVGFIRSQGGLRDTGGDVATLDPPKGLIAETAEEVKARRSQPTLGGLPDTPKGLGLDEMAQRAIEAGYPLNVSDGISEANALFAALQDELAGRPVYISGEEPDGELSDLAEELSRRAIDLSQMSNDEVAAALEGPPEGETDNPLAGGREGGQTVIALFENSDLSTVLHESGRFFLKAFQTLALKEDAPQGMKDDLATINDFLEVENAAQIGRAEEEKWARGFEAYLMEGKAPSFALADAFARFKAWLTRLYETAIRLNVKMTPEVRDVMDRMVATDAEIAAMREAQEMHPLFTSQRAAGMSDAAWKTYQRMARRAAEQANQTLLEKTMEAVRRKTKKWWKAERADVRAEIESTITSRREYRLIEMLANKRWIGSDRDVPNMRIDRKILVEMFGEGVLAELSVSRLGGKRAIYGTGEGAAHPETVAHFFGFANAAEMVFALQNATRRKAAIEAETDRIMSDRYGDPFTDGSIEDEALAAIHSEQQAKTVIAELRHMAGLAERPTWNMTAKAFRRRASEMISKMTILKAAKPDTFLAAERKAAKQAEDAFARVARGDAGALATAIKHKEHQALNHHLYMQSRNLARMVKTRGEKMRRYGVKAVREAVGSPYIDQIDTLLERFDFRVRGNRAVRRSESLAAFVDRMTREGREDDLAIDQRLIDESRRTHFSRLSVDEFQGLTDTIANLDHLGRYKQYLIYKQRNRRLNESAHRVARQIRKHRSEKAPRGQPARVKQFITLFRDPDTLAISLDGGEEFGPVYEELLRELNEGDARLGHRTRDAAKALREIYLRHYTRAEITSFAKETNIPGAGVWTREQALAIALNMGNRDGFLRIMDPRVDARYRMTHDRLDAILATLDERDWRFAQDILDEINKLWPEVAETHRRDKGVVPRKVEAEVMTSLAPAFFTGGYYPLVYDSSVGGRRAMALAEVTEKKQQTHGMGTGQVKNGMTYQRLKSAGGQVVLMSLSVPTAHIRNTLRFIELREAVANAQRVLNHDAVIRAFQDTGSMDEKNALQLVVDAAASGPKFNNDWVNWVFRAMKTNFTLAKLGLNLRTVILQVTGLPQSAVVVGWKNMARAAADYYRSPARMTALAGEVTGMSEVMNIRRRTMEKDLYDIHSEIALASPVKGMVAEARDFTLKLAMAPITWMQFWAVDMPTWLAAFRKYQHAGNSEGDSIHYADRIVERAQDSGRLTTRSMIELGSTKADLQQADTVRIFSVLAGYMFNKANRIQVEAMRGFYGITSNDPATVRIGTAAQATVNIFMMLVAEAALMAMLNAAMSDDDEPEDVLALVGSESLAVMAGGIPFLRDIYGMTQGFDGGVYASAIGDVAGLLAQAKQGELDAAFWRNALNVSGLLTGLPTTAASRGLGFLMEPDKVTPSEALFGYNPLNKKGR